ncbi:MAG: glycerol-3-phosphate 1-O-acyltransferase PlsY [Chthonomonas sp.]|nr:glycerol-3-phosphate 1-O-acyltransferase PlsY [Chthonomonas sp.]
MNHWTLLPFAFLLGAVPFGYLVARAKGVNIFEAGSGNIGATNVNRVLGAKAGLLVLFLDIAKGLAPALYGVHMLHSIESGLWLGLAAVLGHTFSPFLKFKGGKGVATTLGVVIGATPLVALGSAVVFLPLLAMFRYVSLSSIVAAASLPLWDLLFKMPPVAIVFHSVIAAFILFKHRANIVRIRNGTESKFREKKEPEA